MLLAAAQDMGLDLSRSWIIGDKLSDLEAGAAVGCRTILVRTGHGMEAELPANSASLNLQGTVPTIGEAVELFTKRNSQPNAA
jgi:D-glycero-D-manno-heptose 1,7-bisphosphate phosphatase